MDLWRKSSTAIGICGKDTRIFMYSIHSKGISTKPCDINVPADIYFFFHKQKSNSKKNIYIYIKETLFALI